MSNAKTPLVSLIVTTKNSSSELKTLLPSARSQSYRNTELIVVDNYSEDDTRALAKKFTKKVYKKGPERSAQRNYGVSKARGKYVFILDADMELRTRVVQSAVDKAEREKYKLLIVPEDTAGESFMAHVRRFERDMYKGDSTIEVARFFERRVFLKFGGYDTKLTGAEDYDLPKRISKKYKIGWSSVALIHHEERLTVWSLLRKKFYYASQSVAYADKHPELVKSQGTILFRRTYLANWRKFVAHPVLGLAFLVVRFLTMIAAVLGYIHGAGIIKFVKTFVKMISK